MKTCYINGMGNISAQNTFGNEGFLEEIVTYDTNILPAIAPKFTDYIPAAASRRMAKGVKMGVVASTLALQEAGIESPDAIITGSGMGCVRDSEKFLENILDNDEQFLTPTSFIQSIHNTVGAQVALGLNCKAYNVTHIHSAISFESALLDALLLFDENEADDALVGGIEELGEHTIKLYRLIGHVKKEEVQNLQILQSKSEGSTYGEGAQFFVLSANKQASTYASIKDVEIISRLEESEVEKRAIRFLERSQLHVSDIDAVVLGNNGDAAFDTIYQNLQRTIFEDTPQLAYKHLCGEYNTSSAFGLWAAAKILKTQHIPPVLKLNIVSKPAYKNILLYNQYRGKNHSFVLLTTDR